VLDGALETRDVCNMHDRTSALATAVRRRRKTLDLTQVELGELAECSTRFVHQVENGKPTVRLDKLLDVLQVLGLELQISRGRGRIKDDTSSPAGRSA
jgi:HTH-type transcriptional regulator/antitoxin HipB